MILIWHCSKRKTITRLWVSSQKTAWSAQRHSDLLYLLDEVSKEDGLLSQGIVDQAFREEDHPVGKVVLREPRHNTLLLHVRAAGDVNDQVSQVLPVSAHAGLRSELFGVWTLTHKFKRCLTLAWRRQRLRAWPWGRCPWLTRWQQKSHQCWRPRTPLPAAARSDRPLRLSDPPLGKKKHFSKKSASLPFKKKPYSYKVIPLESKKKKKKKQLNTVMLIKINCTTFAYI